MSNIFARWLGYELVSGNDEDAAVSVASVKSRAVTVPATPPIAQGPRFPEKLSSKKSKALKRVEQFAETYDAQIKGAAAELKRRLKYKLTTLERYLTKAEKMDWLKDRFASAAGDQEEETRIKESVKLTDRRLNPKQEAAIYAIIFTSLGVFLLAAFIASSFSMPFLLSVLPWAALTSVAFISATYLRYSKDGGNSTGRGIAIIMSLATAIMGYHLAAPHIPMIANILFSVGAFFANLILYRTSVPTVLATLKTRLTSGWEAFQKIPTYRKLFWVASIPLSLLTGVVLTMSMWSAWAGLVPAAASIMGAPYILIPVLVIVGIANCAFVFRSLSRVCDLFEQFLNIKNKGITFEEANGKREYKVLTEKRIKEEKIDLAKATNIIRGQRAFLQYYFGVDATDTYFITTLKISLHVILKLALIAFVVYFSQKALIDANMAHFSENINWFHGLVLTQVTLVLSITAWTSRMLFVCVDFGKILTGLFIKTTDFALKPRNWQNLGVGVASFTASLFRQETWAKLPKSADNFFQRLERNFHTILLRATQDSDNIEVWRKVYGSRWLEEYNSQCEKDLASSSLLYRASYYVTALVISAREIFKWFIVLLNGLSNAFLVAATDGGSKFTASVTDIIEKAPNALRAGPNALTSVTLVATSLIDMEENMEKRRAPILPEATGAADPVTTATTATAAAIPLSVPVLVQASVPVVPLSQPAAAEVPVAAVVSPPAAASPLPPAPLSPLPSSLPAQLAVAGAASAVAEVEAELVAAALPLHTLPPHRDSDGSAAEPLLAATERGPSPAASEASSTLSRGQYAHGVPAGTELVVEVAVGGAGAPPGSPARRAASPTGFGTPPRVRPVKTSSSGAGAGAASASGTPATPATAPRAISTSRRVLWGNLAALPSSPAAPARALAVATSAAELAALASVAPAGAATSTCASTASTARTFALDLAGSGLFVSPLRAKKPREEGSRRRLSASDILVYPF